MSFEPASMKAPEAAAPLAASTPTGTQALAALGRRRFTFGLLVVLTIASLAYWLASILAVDGFGIVDALMLLAFLVNAPWIAVGFWNSLIGFLVLHGPGDPIARVTPPARRARDDDPVFVRVAVLMTLRNEDSARAFARLKAVKASLDASGYGECFDYFILSDSSRPEMIEAEEKEFAAIKQEIPEESRLVYRRRENNAGFKAGNVRDFCERWGKNYEIMIPLDADSLMTGGAILRLVRIMQANHKLGILQSLVVGMPSPSLFARVFQFGMRHGMRSFTAGSAWWHGECGPFWGHNAGVRIAPFTEHCRLPELPGKPPFGGQILSHDQIEAVLMRRAGYEVRVLPEEGGSYEDNPPAMPEFAQRDLRWCQGNLQYCKLVDLPALVPTSRFQIAFAIQMFLGNAGVVLFVTLAAFAAATWPPDVAFPTGSMAGLYATWILMYFSPKLFGVLDAMLSSASRYGGSLRLIGSALVETLFTFLIVPISMFATAYFMLALLFGKRAVAWDAQRRDGYRVPWRSALAALAPQTLYGMAMIVFLAVLAPRALPWFLPFLAGVALAVPFAVMTSWPWLGAWAARVRLCAIPEEFEPPAEVAAVLARASQG
jgi:membrane glycosyltransferase